MLKTKLQSKAWELPQIFSVPVCVTFRTSFLIQTVCQQLGLSKTQMPRLHRSMKTNDHFIWPQKMSDSTVWSSDPAQRFRRTPKWNTALFCKVDPVRSAMIGVDQNSSIIADGSKQSCVVLQWETVKRLQIPPKNKAMLLTGFQTSGHCVIN